MECRNVILVQPALARNAEFGPGVKKIYVLYNKKDLAVQVARWFRILNPYSWFDRHMWGAMGKFGPYVDDPRILPIPTLEYRETSSGHLGWRKNDAEYWNQKFHQWSKG